MTMPIAILVASGLIAGAIFLKPTAGEWSMMPSSYKSGVWKLNARTGDLYFCWGDDAALDCRRESAKQ